jgi:hypothetical protein
LFDLDPEPDNWNRDMLSEAFLRASGTLAIKRTLLSQGADVHQDNDEALAQAAADRDVETIRLLWDRDPCEARWDSDALRKAKEVVDLEEFGWARWEGPPSPGQLDLFEEHAPE